MTIRVINECPFCGKFQALRCAVLPTNLGPKYIVLCDALHGKGGCGAHGSYAETEDEAWENWNAVKPKYNGESTIF